MPDSHYFKLVDDRGHTEIALRKRAAYPTTYLRQTGAASYELGYGTSTDTESEFLRIHIRPAGVRISRDAFCTLPLYYACSDKGFLVSNVYSDMVNALETATVSEEGVQHYVTLQHYTDATLIKEVRILRERETLQYEHGELSITHAPGRSWIGSSAAPPQSAKQFRETLNSYFTHFYRTRLQNEHFACEVSGGLDSATLPLFLSSRGVRNFSLCSLLYTGDFKSTQLEKLTALEAQCEAPLLKEPIHESTDFPFNSLLAGARQPFFGRDPFLECREQQLQQLQDQGVTVITTGHGGDDMLEHAPYESELGYGETERMERAEHVMPAFMTRRFYDEYIASAPTAPPRPMTLHSPPLLMFLSTYQNHYIDHDIWPVTPFASPGLYAFCQGLSVEFRANKNIMRMYHEALGFPRIIYNPRQNESFRGSFQKTVQRGTYDLLLQRLLDRSISKQLGYIDSDALYDFYTTLKKGAVRQTEQEARSTAAIHLQRWMDMELSLQAAANLRLP